MSTYEFFDHPSDCEDYFLKRNAEKEKLSFEVGDRWREMEQKIMERVRTKPLGQKMIFLMFLEVTALESEALRREHEKWFAEEGYKYR